MTNQNIVLPAIALRGDYDFPDMIVHFDVSREHSVRAVEAAMLHDQKIFLVTQKDPEVETPELAECIRWEPLLYQTGCETSAGSFRVLVEGKTRRTSEIRGTGEPFIRSRDGTVYRKKCSMPEPVKEAMLSSIKELFQRYCMRKWKSQQRSGSTDLESIDNGKNWLTRLQ